MSFLSAPRLLNYRLNRRESREGHLLLKSYPLFVYADITSRCNLSCIMCEQNYLKVPRGDMTLETFQRLLPVLDRALILFLHATGEPLLNRDFLQILRAAKDRGVLVGFSTNGHLLTREVAEGMVDAGLNFLNFSIDSTDPGQYAQIRGKGNLARVLENIDLLNDVKARRGKHNPLMGIAFCAMKRNLQELPRVVDLAARKKMLSVTARNIIFSEPLSGESLFREEDISGDRATARQVAEEARRRAREAGVMLRLDRAFFQERPTDTPGGTPQTPACGELWQGVFVNHEGSVRPCCISAHFMGDLKTAPFEAIWNHPEYVSFRCRLREGRLPESCAFCETSWFRNRMDSYQSAFLDLLKEGRYRLFYKSMRHIFG